MPERKLVAHADGAGRVWIEDAEHGRFPPDGIFISFPQCERKRDVKATFELADLLAAAGEYKRQRNMLLEAAKDAVELVRNLRLAFDVGYRGLTEAHSADAFEQNTEMLRAAIAECEGGH